MDITTDNMKMGGFYMIFIGIACIGSSFLIFSIDYSPVLSDVLLLLGFPVLLVGTMLFAFSEGYLPNDLLSSGD